MTIAGWIFLVISWGAILSLAAFCVHKALKEPCKDLKISTGFFVA
ncbi:MAG: hypothetical protein PHP17_02695 [Candidatus Omnitrophica bacterium]|nr:hypothetical protein [Candidatus Omnitrophota bacterium]